MEANEKVNIRLRIALVFKNVIDNNKKEAEKQKGQKINNPNLITSYRKWETASGVPIASISEIMNGERTAATTTLVTLSWTLGINMESFGKYFDSITDAEIEAYRKDVLTSKSKKKK